MYNALQPIDPETGKSRGYAFLLSYDFSDHDNSSGNMPRSFLFRSKNEQDPSRGLLNSCRAEHDRQHDEQ
jgi:hypothetical protein